MAEWISVKDKLPTTTSSVLIVVDGRRVELGWYGSHTKIWHREYIGNPVWPVTHWMPLPEPPKEDV